MKPQKVNWKVKEEKESLTVETDSLKVVVNKAGELAYFSKDGNPLLNELSERTYITDDASASYKDLIITII